MDDKPQECAPCSCRTINLAKQVKYPKTDMQPYNKCGKPCPKPCRQSPIPEAPMHPSCIRVCTKDELLIEKCGKKIPKIKIPPTHGKLLYLVKAGIVGGLIYFSSREGFWGDQVQTLDCVARWKAYLNAISTRRPPQFDVCGNLISEGGTPGLFPRVYRIYKAIITTCFSGMVQIPTIAKCSYIAWQKEKELRARELKEKIKG